MYQVLGYLAPIAAGSGFSKTFNLKFIAAAVYKPAAVAILWSVPPRTSSCAFRAQYCRLLNTVEVRISSTVFLPF